VTVISACPHAKPRLFFLPFPALLLILIAHTPSLENDLLGLRRRRRRCAFSLGLCPLG
jgi:hypothetical protein